jgi:hypothetical protein
VPRSLHKQALFEFDVCIWQHAKEGQTMPLGAVNSPQGGLPRQQHWRCSLRLHHLPSLRSLRRAGADGTGRNSVKSSIALMNIVQNAPRCWGRLERRAPTCKSEYMEEAPHLIARRPRHGTLPHHAPRRAKSGHSHPRPTQVHCIYSLVLQKRGEYGLAPGRQTGFFSGAKPPGASERAPNRLNRLAPAVWRPSLWGPALWGPGRPLTN